MKRLSTLLALVGMAICLNAQSPQKISYQAVIRNGSNQLITNSPVGLRLKILKGSAMVEVYIETQSRSSNTNGLITTEIGSGIIVFGDLASINWADGPYYLKTETDPSGGTNYSITGTSQILSVPYALYATKAGNGFSGNYNDLTNKPSLFDGTWLSLTGKPNFAPVATSGSYNDLNNKPVLFSGNYNDLTNKPITDGSETKVTAGTNILVSGSGTTANPYIINLDIPHHIGELYGGGVVFYVDHTGKHGLICSLIDLNFQVWSNINDSVGASSMSTWDGQINTTKIMSQPGHTKSAAKLCDDYSNVNYGTGIYSDWFLPSIKQLCAINNAIYEINKAIEGDGNNTTIPITYQSYWSSNEWRNPGTINYGYGYYYEFEKGAIGWASKSNTLFVRPIRYF